MYFLRIKPLKESLATAGIDTKEQFKYLMAWMLLLTWASSLSFKSPGFWETVSGAGMLVITFLGILYAYLRNGGSKGTSFLERYLSIGWVVNIRVFLVIGLVVLGGAYIMRLLGYYAGDYYESRAGMGQTVLASLAEIYIALSIGRHIGYVRKEYESRKNQEAMPFSSLQISERLKKFEEAVTQREMPMIRVDVPGARTGRTTRRKTAKTVRVSARKSRTRS